jgi:DNA-binding beta-propeller fold protein YncE
VKVVLGVLGLAAILAGCGSAGTTATGGGGVRSARDSARLAASHASDPRRHSEGGGDRATRSSSEALVTAEGEDRLVAVNPATGQIERRVAVPADPEFVAANAYRVVVVSPGAGAVTLLRLPSLRRMRVLRGFDAPHIAAIAPGGRYAYVTDDARGELAVIGLDHGRVVDRVSVGQGAHHLAFRPGGGQAWVALGESARRIVVLDTSDPADPRVIAGFDPGFPAHDLRFAPGGRRVWVTSSSGDAVAVFGADGRRRLFDVRGGAPPQHVSFAGDRAYVTSGYGSRIEAVSAGTGRILKVAPAPYGSFDLAAADGLVATASLLRGTLTVYDDRLRVLHTVQVASAARDVALSGP